MVSLIAVVVLVAPAAHLVQAASGDTVPGGIVAGVAVGQPPGPGTAGSACTWRRADPHDAHLGRGGEVSRLIADRRYWLYERWCGTGIDLVWVPELAPDTLAEHAADEVRRLIPEPQVATAPPVGAAVVHVPIWFWVTEASWQAIEATAWVPVDDGVLWATARAVPTSLWLDPGDDSGGATPVTCAGPGPRWTQAHGDEAFSPCSITYRRSSDSAPSGTHRAVLRVVWSTSWTASTGEGGPLEPLHSQVTLPIAVNELHALVSH